MIDPTLYLTQVAWETLAKNIVMLSPWTYRVTVKYENVGNVGRGQQEVGFYFKDFLGETYLITAINVGGIAGNIEITDSFKCGHGPVPDRTAIVYKSVGDGKSPFLAPAMYQRLDKSAFDKSRAFELDILYKHRGIAIGSDINITKLEVENIEATVNPDPLLGWMGGLKLKLKNLFTTLLSLSDTPSSYVGQALKGLRVKADVTGIEFYTLPVTDNESVQSLSGLTPSWNVLNGIHATITLSGNTTITLQNLTAGQSGNLTITNPTAIYTLTFVGYTNEISPAIWKADNQPIVSGLTLKDALSWYYDGALLLWNGTNGYKP